ncbi:MAG: chemotaxis protein CheW [Phormidesmis sp.]
MNSVLNPVAPTLEPPEVSAETIKYITFKVAGYVFALPSQEILKVVATPARSEGGLVSMGLVQLGQYSIQILDLPELLSLKTVERKSSSAENPPFLMVLQNADKDLLGIAVDDPPDLLEVPSYALKPVPPEKRLTHTLKWVSHVVTYSLGNNRHTLLLLDSSLLLAVPQADPEVPGLFEIQPPLAAEGKHKNAQLVETAPEATP